MRKIPFLLYTVKHLPTQPRFLRMEMNIGLGSTEQRLMALFCAHSIPGAA